MSTSSVPAPNPVSRKAILWGAGALLTAFVVLLTLKLCGLAWSWWLITAPLWGPWALLVAALVLGLGWSFFFALIRRA